MRRSVRSMFALVAPTLILAGGRAAPPESAIANDNRVAAGLLANGVLTLQLEAREVTWYPESESGVGIPVFAFGESGKRAMIPGPMIRVRVGTDVKVSIRNTLPKALRLHGFNGRSAGLDTIVLAPGAEHSARFTASAPGTFFYWGRTTQTAGPLGQHEDAMLIGAFIIDSANGGPLPNERVLILGGWTDTLSGHAPKSEEAHVVQRGESIPRDRWFVSILNGKSWPHTERLSYTAGDTVRFRVISGGRFPHPMHLHGFYFDVMARGTAVGDSVLPADQRRSVVTQWMPGGQTFDLRWVAERPGNWLFHCHFVAHISTANRLPSTASRPTDHTNHAESGMAGLVMAIRVAPKPGVRLAGDPRPRARLRVFITQRDSPGSVYPIYRYVLQQGNSSPARDSILPLSSTLRLRRHEPTEITVVNLTRETTAVHWHGLELESYYDGVAGWSGWGNRIAPPIVPGDSFVVRLTPPRAGTFMYHTHADEGMQLASGMYGALIVVPPGSADTTDRVFVFARNGHAEEDSVVINGTAAPPPVELRAGVAHRIRVVSIADLEAGTVRLWQGDNPIPWRFLSKDGAELPVQDTTRLPTPIHPGETVDFEILRQRPETLTLRFGTAPSLMRRMAFRSSGGAGQVPRYNIDIPVIIR
jgi:FtsP/CotA-like multicopper oxidase with cupredoxin domain